VDLAKAHVVALKRLLKKKNLEKSRDFQFGNWHWQSVLVIQVEKVSGKSWFINL
jgi:UDP-glucose 4-epimerase